MKKILAERKNTIYFLRTMVKEPATPNEFWARPSTRRNRAITLLGELRAGEAAGAIAEWLIPHPGQIIARVIRAERKNEYASIAMLALVKIGKPANKVLLDKLEQIDDQTVKEQLARMGRDMRTACCRTLGKIEGREGAKRLLAKRIAKAKDDRSRANFEAALRYLETVEDYVIAPPRLTRRVMATPTELAKMRALVKNTRSTPPQPESSPTASASLTVQAPATKSPWPLAIGTALAGLLLGLIGAALIFRRRRA